MLIFTAGPRSFHYLGLALLLAQFFLFVWGLPPFQAGIWLQTEPILLAVFIFAVLTCLWLLAGVYKQWLALEKPHALWLILLAWVGWQFLATLAAPLPLQSWLGPPQLGEGTAWYVSMLLTCLLAYPLWRMPAYRRVIIITACGALLIECALHLFNPDEFDQWKPGRWASYLGFMMGYLWIATMLGTHTASGLVYCLMVPIGYIALYTSWNRSAILLLACAMTGSLLLVALRRHRLLRRFFHPGKAWRTAAIVACFLPMVWIVAGTELASRMEREDDLKATKMLAEKGDSIGARVSLNQTILSILHHEPGHLLIGTGWGRFNDDIFKYVLVKGVYVYRDGKFKPNWNMISGHSFHSHNQPMEALLALGVPGMLLWFGIFGLALWHLPRRYFWHAAPMLMGLVALSYLWFEIAQVIPYHALALTALTAVCAGRPSPAKTPAWMVPAIAVITLLMAWTGWQHYGALRYGSTITQAMGKAPVEQYPPSWLTEDRLRGGDRLRASAMHYAELAARIMREGTATPETVVWYKNFFDAAHDMARSPSTGERAAWLALWMDYKLLLDFPGPEFTGLRHEAAASIEESVLRVTQAAPLRDDLATPFLLNLDEFTRHDPIKQVDILSRILAVAPNHRGALWVLGNIFVHTKGYEEVGREMIKHTIALRVQDIYPITDKELAAFQ